MAVTLTDAPAVTTFDPLALVGGRRTRQIPGSISFTKVSSYQRCPARYKLQYLDNVPTIASGAMLAGRAIHEVIEQMVIEEWFEDPFAVEVLGRQSFLVRFGMMIDETGGEAAIEWSGRARIVEDEQGNRVQAIDEETGRPVFSVGGSRVLGQHAARTAAAAAGKRAMPVWLKGREDLFWWSKMGPTMLKRAATILRDDVNNGYNVVAANVERQVAAWLDGPGSTIVTGVIDHLMLTVDPNGEKRLVDWKAGSHLSMDPLQLATYAWLLRQPEREEDRIYVDEGEFVYLRGTTKESWRKPHSLTSLIPLVPQFFREALAGIGGEFFPMRPSGFCGSCWVRASCEYGRTLPENDVG